MMKKIQKTNVNLNYVVHFSSSANISQGSYEINLLLENNEKISFKTFKREEWLEMLNFEMAWVQNRISEIEKQQIL